LKVKVGGSLASPVVHLRNLECFRVVRAHLCWMTVCIDAVVEAVIAVLGSVSLGV
jgi:hypothetical protein